MKIPLLIFEDNDTLRRSLPGLLEEGGVFKVVGAYPSPVNLKKILKETNPEIVILDINMPKVDGITAIPQIKEFNPDISVVMYTQFEDEEKLFKCLCSGADGYVLKKTSPLKLIEAINEVREGGAPMSPAIAKKVFSYFHKPQKPAKKKYDLTSRETEVLRLLVKGCSVKFIAAELNIAFETARSHLKNIYRKLQVNCGKEAIAKILAEKIDI